MEISIARTTVTCDNCRAALDLKGDDKDEALTATLTGRDGLNKQFHLCNEVCLGEFVNKRVKAAKAKRAKASCASEDWDFKKNIVTLDFGQKASASLAKCSKCGTIANIATQPEICMGAVKCEKCGNPVTQATALETNPR